MRRPTARSLILELLSTLPGSSMPVGALVAAGGLFGIRGGSVRVALTRLLAAGRVERDERGRYRLGATALPVQELVSGWRSLERRTVRWDGSWLAVHEGEMSRSAKPRGARALRLLGFRELAPGLQVRPANLRGGSGAVRGALHGLGLDPAALVCELRDLDPAREAHARARWDTDALRASHRRSLAELEQSAARLPQLSDDEAMAESFLLGGRVLQELVLDPLLPDSICPSQERTALAAAMRRYDRLGRSCWAGLMARFGLPHRRAPVDTGTTEGVGRLVAA